MDKRSKIKLMRRQKKLFPWLRTFCSKYSEKFFDTGKSETFEYLFENVYEEMKNIYLGLNKEKAEDFFNILNTFFLHFWWQMRWNSTKKWKSYWKKVQSPKIAANDSQLQYCVQLLYYMILLSIFLTSGDENSDWIGRILTALTLLTDAVDILCTALLLINDLKKKHKPIYRIILKHTLCCETVKNTAVPQTYCKVILLFRRLIKLTKDKQEVSQILLSTSKLKVPCDIHTWLSSQNIEDSKDLNYDNLTKDLLLRSYPDELLRKLSEILIEPDFCNGQFLKVNTIDVESVPSNINSENLSESGSDLLYSANKINVENNLSETTTSYLTSNTCNNVMKNNNPHNPASNMQEGTCIEMNVNNFLKLLEKTKKRKAENVEDDILNEPSKNVKKHKKHKKKSKDKLCTVIEDINQEFGTYSQTSGVIENPSMSKKEEEISLLKSLEEELKTFYAQQDCNFKRKGKKLKTKRKKEQMHVKKSNKHSKEKQVFVVDNPDKTSKVESFSETKIQNKKKKLKKHSKEKRKKIGDPDKAGTVESSVKSQNPLSQTEIKFDKSNSTSISEQIKKKKRKKKKDDLKKISNEKMSLNVISEGTGGASSIEKENLINKPKKREKKKDDLKQISNEKISLNVISEGTGGASSIEKENLSNKPKKSSKSKMKKLFNNDLYYLTESQKEIQQAKTITNEDVIVPKMSTLKKNSLLKMDNVKFQSQDDDMTDIDSNKNSSVNLNLLSNEINSTFTDVSLSDLLKFPKIQIYRHNAALGIEDQQSLKAKTKRQTISKDSKETNKKNELPSVKRLSDDSQKSELSSLKNDLLLASKKILQQSCVSEPHDSPSLFDDESVTTNGKNNNDDVVSFHSPNMKHSLIIKSDSVNETSMSNDYESTVVQPFHFKQNDNEKILSSFDSISERSFNSLLNSGLTPLVKLEDIHLCKSTQNYISTTEKTFTTNLKSNNKVSTSTPTAINLEMNVSQELTTENIARVNELYGETKSDLINYFCSNEKINLVSPLPIDNNLTHTNWRDSCSPVSPSLIQTSNSNILINEILSEFETNSVSQSLCGVSVSESNINEHGFQFLNNKTEKPIYKNVSTATSLVDSKDFSVNCNLINDTGQKSNNISSVQVIINLTTDNNQSTVKKHQFVANFDFKSVNSPKENPVSSSVSLNPVNNQSPCIINNSRNLNLNQAPNYHPLSIIPFNQVTNYIDSRNCSNSSTYSNNKLEEIGLCVDMHDSGSTQNQVEISNQVTNSADIISKNCSNSNILSIDKSKEIGEYVDMHNSSSTPNQVTNSTENYTVSKNCSNSNFLSIKKSEELGECVDMHDSHSTQNQVINSVENYIVSKNCGNSNILPINKSEEIGQCVDMHDSGSTQDQVIISKNSSQEKNVNNSLSQSVNSKHIFIDNYECLKKDTDELYLAAELSNKNSSCRTSTIYSDDDISSTSSSSNFSDFQEELLVGENLEIGTSPKKALNCKNNKFHVDPEPDSFVIDDPIIGTPITVTFEHMKKDNASAKRSSETDSILNKTKSKKKKTPLKASTPVNHGYNLRTKRSSPLKLDDYLVSVENIS